MIGLRLLLFVLLALARAEAAIDAYQFQDAAQEARFRGLIDELRCPKCQNTNISGSDAPLAADLRQKVYDMVKSGQSDADIIAYMTQRYGDFILYRPPLKAVTWPLWFGPFVGMALAAVLLALWVRRRSRAAAQPPPLNAEERARLDALLASGEGEDRQ